MDAIGPLTPDPSPPAGARGGFCGQHREGEAPAEPQYVGSLDGSAGALARQQQWLGWSLALPRGGMRGTARQRIRHV